MDFRNYNDFEIIDLIKQGNEEALELMFGKYKYLVAKKISHFNLTDDYDDCFQEGMIVLYKSVLKFDDERKKSFTRYFETNLEHHFISTIRTRSRKAKFQHEKMHQLVDFSVEEVQSDNYSKQDILSALEKLSLFEKKIFTAKFLQNKEVKTIADEQNIPVKKVYNAVDRIRQKIKMHLR